MTCPIETPENAGWLLDYCSGKLDPAAAAILENHILVCPACRDFAAGQQSVWKALDTWNAAPASADFDRRLYRRMAESASWWERLWQPMRPVLFRQGLPIAAAAALLVVAGILLERPAVVAPVRPQPVQVEAVAPDQAEDAIEEMEMIREFSVMLRSEIPPRM